MSRKTHILGALGALVLTAAAQTSALAAPPAAPAAPAAQNRSGTGARASIRLDVGHATAWVGQALPVTLRAYFRGVVGVTLEGAPQIASREIITSELAPEPKQVTQIIAGEPTLVATWTGTVTPSSAGPVDFSIELPVRVRYREAAPQVVSRDTGQDDPFGDMDADPFGASMFARMQHMMDQQMAMMQTMGRVREQTATLQATAHLDALALPVQDQPASFSGAVGRYDLTASASSTHLRASEPLTLRIAVDGEGDLDRVDVPGVATSDTWKAYPPKLTSDATPPGKKRGPRVFEQVLVPLRGGDMTVPAVSLTAFDPVTGRYVTRETRPIAVSVDASAALDPAGASPTVSASASLPATGEAVRVDVSPIPPWRIGLRVAPVLILVAVAALLGVLRRARAERALRRAMRRAVSEKAVGSFFVSARRLIEARLARRWGVPPEAVTPLSIRERLGERGETLAEVMASDQSLRFGRATFDHADLLALCSSVERSLRGAS
jgi:hypothetical protein